MSAKHARLAPLSALALLSCSGLDPELAETHAYLVQLQPLLQENSLLAERVLLQAAGIYNETAGPEQVVVAWQQEIVPVAEHLYHQATIVTAPDGWNDEHAEIATIWGERASAYRGLGEALRTGDAKAWNTSRALADEVKLAEESWFDELNARLGPEGLVVDPYP